MMHKDRPRPTTEIEEPDFKQVPEEGLALSAWAQPIQIRLGANQLRIDRHPDPLHPNNDSYVLTDSTGNAHVSIPDCVVGIVGRAAIIGEALGPDASRRHISIRRNGSEFLIKDLNSKNGTSANGEAAASDNVELLRRRAPNFVNDVNDLSEFLDSIGDDEDMYRAIHNFYMRINQENTLNESEVKHQKNQLSTMLAPQREWIKKHVEAGSDQVLEPQNMAILYQYEGFEHWVPAAFPDNAESNIGRLYLNLDLPNRYKTFYDLVIFLKQCDFGASYIKAKTVLPNRTMQRADNTVVYFESAIASDVFGAVSEFHRLHTEQFCDQTPRFTARAVDNRITLGGVSFAQSEHSVGGRMSSFFEWMHDAGVCGADNLLDRCAKNDLSLMPFDREDGRNAFHKIMGRLQP